MPRILQGRRPSPALIISVVALSLALGGTAFAAATVGTQDIQKGAVTSNKIANQAVITKKIADLGVTKSKLAGGAVSPSKIAANAVRTAKIKDEAVTGDKLAPDSVSTSKIQDAAVTGPKILDSAVNSAKIEDGTVGNSDLADNSVNAAKIEDGQVRSAELASITQVTNNAGIAANGTATVSVACPAGSRVLSGGHTSTSFLVGNVSSLRSGNGWIAAFKSTSGAAQTVTVTAYCLSA